MNTIGSPEVTSNPDAAGYEHWRDHITAMSRAEGRASTPADTRRIAGVAAFASGRMKSFALHASGCELAELVPAETTPDQFVELLTTIDRIAPNLVDDLRSLVLSRPRPRRPRRPKNVIDLAAARARLRGSR
jgi:hypothetical protein